MEQKFLACQQFYPVLTPFFLGSLKAQAMENGPFQEKISVLLKFFPMDNEGPTLSQDAYGY